MAHGKNSSKEFTSEKNLRKLINLIPMKLLNNLVEKYGADRWVTLLHTEKFLRLHIFMRVLKPQNLSMRGIVEYSKNLLAKSITRLTRPVSRTGFSDRQNKIPANLFLELLMVLTKVAGKNGKKLITQVENIKIFDTTFITLSLKIFNWATICNQTKKGTLKIGLRIDDGQTIPDHLLIDFKNTNDNNMFEQMLNLMVKGITYIFDRGFFKIKVLEKIHLSNNFFITRMYPTYTIEVIKEIVFSKKKQTNNLIEIIKDQLVYVGSGRNKLKSPLRLITAINKEDKSKLLFLTNRMDLKPLEIAELYRHRWQIEILFRWLKQYLRINKFIARSLNGVLVQIYIALITHVLLLLYRQLHKLNISLLQTLRLLENYTINAFAIFMFRLGLSTSNRRRLLKKNNPQFLEALCF